MQHAILAQGLYKQFTRYHANKPTTLQEAILRGLRRMKPIDQFWALRDVSFSIEPGRMVGLIGRNGSGKSTLLRLLGGIGRPDKGKIRTYGKVRALLDLGVGLHPDLTGRENVFVSGVISGLTRREVQQRFDSIVGFAELESSIDNPLRTYSTGMRLRLGFAIAVHTSPEILLLDEVLTVGDLSFQRKCLDRINQFKAEGCAIILVSHDESQIQQLCDEVIYLREGQLVAHGEPEIVIGQYVAEISNRTHQRTPQEHLTSTTESGIELRLHENRFGSLEMQITNVQLLSAAGFPVKELHSGDALQIEIEYSAPQPIASPIFGVTITREDQLACYDTNTAATGQATPTIQGQGKITLHLKRLDLNSGQYYVNVSIYESEWNYAYDHHWHVYPLLIRQSGYEKGILSVPHQWEFDNAQTLAHRGH
ncbi:ABC transporter ATP-binding protein [Oculatella sp. FACHB-28]|uniref:ABC transporter ATP-binding protein n=1 Tax=Oculatella sp. FACHB-28 TaxID=2692845 RepID=UPI0016871D88|nr:ABC transporter ATP-binding protein [Oculatella sp. FACHB-28]MBD2059293.1 ABC transporter ATP-binding protein [Oculatella sp. FACHB-28]